MLRSDIYEKEQTTTSLKTAKVLQDLSVLLFLSFLFLLILSHDNKQETGESRNE